MQRATPRATPRPYRSSKRPRPCDRCRGRKLRCLLLRESLCERCRDDGVLCTFLQRANRHSSVNQSRNLEQSPQNQTRSQNEDHSFGSEQINHESTLLPSPERNTGDQLSGSANTTLYIDPYQARPLTQLSQSLDDTPTTTALFLGPSSSSDPWLLRHCRYDQSGLYSFGGLQFRNAGGVPTSDRIPVQFLMIDNDRASDGQEAPQAHESEPGRARVTEMIPNARGIRLLRL